MRQLIPTISSGTTQNGSRALPAASLWRTRYVSAERTDEPALATGSSADTAGQAPTYGATAVGNPGEPTSLTPSHEGAVIASDELEASRSFTVGTTTFVVFIDGSIEAHTPAGVRRFASMREVRTYLDDGRADRAP